MPAVGDRGRYAIGGRGAATAATADHCLGALWNPHATKDIVVRSLVIARFSGASNAGLRHTTARGTPGSTQTPDIVNDLLRLLAPISGALLDLSAFSVQPTLSTPANWRWIAATSAGSTGSSAEIYFEPSGIRVPAGTGLALIQLTATATVDDVTFTWDE